MSKFVASYPKSAKVAPSRNNTNGTFKSAYTANHKDAVINNSSRSTDRGFSSKLIVK